MSFAMKVAYVISCLAVSRALAATVKHDWALTWTSGAPNGQEREMIKINGEFPGPALICDEDDDIEITVRNYMPFNTSVHWHGLAMHGTPWSDGTPGLSQKPIEMGQSFIYRFKASPGGTHWYHSHSRTTLLDGLYGPIFIRRSPDQPTPWHLISDDPADISTMDKATREPSLMLISDWSRFKSWEYIEAEEKSALAIFCVDSILINGKGSVYCPGVDFLVDETSTYMKYGLYPRQVNDKGCFPHMKSTQGPYLRASRPELIPLHLQEGCLPSIAEREIIEVDADSGWASLNFICAATFKTIVFSVDEHPMWVYEVDGEPIEPQLVDTVHMYAGERYSVLIKLDKPARDYTIRVADNGLTQIITEYATLRYRGGTDRTKSIATISYGGQNGSGVVTLDRQHLPPYPPNPPAPHADAQHILKTHRWGSPWQYTMSGGGTYQEDRSAYEPLLYNPHSVDALDENLVIRTKNGSWVDLILQVGSLPDQPQEFPHMMHKHTGKTWQIGAGDGIWNYSSVEEAMEANPARFNLVNPNWRDTFVTSFDGPAWLVLRYQVTNPGPWLFHCHIETHLAGGMAVAILDGIDVWPEIPPEYGPDQRGYPVGALPGLQSGGGPVKGVAECAAVKSIPAMATQEPGHEQEGWKTTVKAMMAFLKSLISDTQDTSS
ncbi:Uu.00g140370.m01.CDS01 [Anthostomella pinea]|uniref:Uu.00g140370.m01.CDS01 n=1 Tax=Anthostomella pinea TaxID=933095 RepID=A0AAI8VQ12_9PEZI|nr:Uu.00g140370.m01.CDS01 [Anthostomella pinea]